MTQFLCQQQQFNPSNCRSIEHHQMWSSNTLISVLGSYGVVYKAKELHTNSYVALKKVNADLLDEGFPRSYMRYVLD